MNTKKNFLNLAVAFLVVFNSAIVMAASKSDAETACSAAEGARVAAAKVKMEWTTTGKLIKKANAAIGDGDFAKAIKLCKKAKFEGDAAVEQARSESIAWKTRVPQ